uniref:Uncharacterized protein n=1 Tax=Trichogramma kaykai TaxID=54128 RepID=A0ABD2VVX1_9HYME
MSELNKCKKCSCTKNSIRRGVRSRKSAFILVFSWMFLVSRTGPRREDEYTNSAGVCWDTSSLFLACYTVYINVRSRELRPPRVRGVSATTTTTADAVVVSSPNVWCSQKIVNGVLEEVAVEAAIGWKESQVCFVQGHAHSQSSYSHPRDRRRRRRRCRSRTIGKRAARALLPNTQVLSEQRVWRGRKSCRKAPRFGARTLAAHQFCNWRIFIVLSSAAADAAATTTTTTTFTTTTTLSRVHPKTPSRRRRRAAPRRTMSQHLRASYIMNERRAPSKTGTPSSLGRALHYTRREDTFAGCFSLCVDSYHRIVIANIYRHPLGLVHGKLRCSLVSVFHLISCRLERGSRREFLDSAAIQSSHI